MGHFERRLKTINKRDAFANSNYQRHKREKKCGRHDRDHLFDRVAERGVAEHHPDSHQLNQQSGGRGQKGCDDDFGVYLRKSQRQGDLSRPGANQKHHGRHTYQHEK